MRGRARAARRGARASASAGRCARPRSARSPTRAACGCFDGDELVGDMPVERARRRLPALRPRARGAGRADLPATRRARLADDAAPARDAARAARLAEHRLASAGPSSSTTRSSARARCAGPSAADAAVLMLEPDGGTRRDRRLDRRQRPARRLRPVHGRGRGGARVRAQPRLRRRRAARPHQLPQLRQPREAAHRLAAHARGRGPARRLPRARRAGRGRQRLALQRGRRGADLPDAGRRDGRQAARPGAPCRALGFAEEGHAIALVGPFEPALDGLGAREAARARWPAALPPVDLAAPGATRSARVREAVRAGALRHGARRRRGRPRRARSPSAASRAASGAQRRRSSDGDAGAVRRGPGRRDRAPAPREAVASSPSALERRAGRCIGEVGRRRGSTHRAALLALSRAGRATLRRPPTRTRSPRRAAWALTLGPPLR